MATDMQPFMKGIPPHSTHAAPVARDRQATVEGSSPSRTFNSLLERAEAHRAAMTPEPASARAASKPTSPARSSHHSKVEPDKQAAARSTEAARQERTAGLNEEPCGKADCVSDKEVGSPKAEATTQQAEDQSAQRQEILVAAMLLPAPAIVPTEVQASDAPDSELDPSADGAGKIAATAVTNPHETSSPQLAAVNPSVETSEEALVGDAATALAQKSEMKESAEKAQPGEGMIDLSAFPQLDSHGEVPEVSADRLDAAVTANAIAPENVTTVAATVTTRTAEAGTMKQAEGDWVDRPTFLEDLAENTPVSAEQGSAGTGKFLENESEPFAGSSADPDRSMPNQGTTNGATDRLLFLDRMSGLNQPTSLPADSAVGRNEAGQPAAVFRVAESERMSELRGALPVSQSVMLDLDPLDMGPLRVRVMMSDQTVHAHIRTEHGELGQGLLQQGQSLESSLRTTGLEMGMLRVTVDQQQGRSDNAWMFQQQHQDRPAVPPGQRSTTGEEERSARGATGEYTSERVSIFA
ncbi:MAG: flagellar hook-length control protein FliK [Nitrospira sp.]|nr:flagellar hook-length control protein FliK [Nitrospira sp.]